MNWKIGVGTVVAAIGLWGAYQSIFNGQAARNDKVAIEERTGVRDLYQKWSSAQKDLADVLLEIDNLGPGGAKQYHKLTYFAEELSELSPRVQIRWDTYQDERRGLGRNPQYIDASRRESDASKWYVPGVLGVVGGPLLLGWGIGERLRERRKTSEDNTPQ